MNYNNRIYNIALFATQGSSVHDDSDDSDERPTADGGGSGQRHKRVHSSSFLSVVLCGSLILQGTWNYVILIFYFFKFAQPILRYPMVAVGLGLHAINSGYTVCFEKMVNLVKILDTAETERAAGFRLRNLKKVQLLIIDEL